MSKLDEGLEPSSAVEQPNYMSMTDDEIMNMDFPSDEPMSEPEAPEEAGADEVELEGEEQSNEEELEEDLYGSEEDEDTQEEESDFTPEEEDTLPQEQEELEEEVPTTTNDETDYKAKYEELLAPFKGNGKDIKVDNAEDLRRLAQMGVGYNAKMAALKPIRKVAKMLENAGLLEEDKINFLIDLSKHNPDAINKLIGQSGINPLDIDVDSTEGYKPNTYTVDDRQLDFDEAMVDLKQSPTIQKTLDVVSTKWDEASRRKLYDTPREIQKLDAQIQAGIFDQVMNEVEREKVLGRIPNNVSDIEAYNVIGNRMNAAGAFNTNTAPTATSPKKEPVVPKQDVQRNSRRRAAASTRSKPTKQQPAPANVLNLSDDEFEKLMPNYI